MIMSVITLILLATLCINGDRQNAARRYAQQPRGQMGFKWTRRQYAQQPYGSSYGQPHPQYQPYGKAPMGGFGSAPPSNTDQPETSSTENTESASLSESFEEPEPTSNIESNEGYDDIDNTNTEEPIMNCVHDNCADAFNACFNNEQCKEWMTEWQETKLLKPECVDVSTLAPATENENDQFEEATFETTASGDFDTTSNTESESTASTETGYYYYYDTTSSTSGSTENTENTENTYDEEFDTSFTSTETSGTDNNDDEDEESKCEYNQLFWDAYNCGVENYCYADQLKLAQSDQHIVQSPSNYRVPANVSGSKSSSSNTTILIVALSSALGAIVMFEITRRLYQAFEDKIQCRCQCECVALMNSWRYLKNKWEQIRGYKYEKTHHDLAAIEESDDAEIYGIESDKDEAITTKETTGVTYNGPLNDDSDISDDVELQRTDDENTMIDDQFVHEEELVTSKDIDNEEEKDTEEQEITVEAVQEPIQEL